MSATYRLATPPPGTNNLFRNVAGKGRRKTAPYVTWLNAAGWEVKAQRVSFRPAGEYVVDITIPLAWRRTRNGRLRDIDGFIKPILDLLVSLQATPDDNLCMKVVAEYRPGAVGFVHVADAVPLREVA